MYTTHMLQLKMSYILTQQNLDQDSSDHNTDSGSEDTHDDGGGMTVSKSLITNSTTNLQVSVDDYFTESTSSKTSLFLHNRIWIRIPLTTDLKMHMMVMTLQ
ncbi:hypothetical protein ATANTOWER_024625 [Ataeniobius toweri]|uniref:Uncharacterized protein n=1 Tax=Ataeniobius toweri TaxID=208326 RepID=A0ABU7C3B1_9TELE|nr:hypothetical protein [Ataeniobius toweri]